MATPKIITAYDITKDQPIVIQPLDGGKIRISSGYEFLDSNGEVIASLGSRHGDQEIVFATLPQAAKDFLVALQDYVYQYNLQVEGMQDV